jgi:hypothetical protein
MRPLCAFVGLGVAVASPAIAAPSTLVIPPSTVFALRIVDLHNRVRSAARVAPISWDPMLAAAADVWAAELARTGRWGHSPNTSRPGQGENLWMGTRGAFSVDQMVGSWAGEARWFAPGRFPNVARTGDWTQVGHYTQMIWPGTSRVGCAVRSSRSNDYLVCRYSPPGNVIGVLVP